MKIQLKVTNPLILDLGLPEYAKPGDAGMDLRACIDEPVYVYRRDRVLIPTGIAVYIKDPTVVGLILPRSGKGHKQGLLVGNGTGVIDSGYQGEIYVSAWHSHINANRIEINPGDKIAQIIFVPIVRAEWDIVSNFQEETDRAGQGFGSTDKIPWHRTRLPSYRTLVK